MSYYIQDNFNYKSTKVMSISNISDFQMEHSSMWTLGILTVTKTAFHVPREAIFAVDGFHYFIYHNFFNPKQVPTRRSLVVTIADFI